MDLIGFKACITFQNSSHWSGQIDVKGQNRPFYMVRYRGPAKKIMDFILSKTILGSEKGIETILLVYVTVQVKIGSFKVII